MTQLPLHTSESGFGSLAVVGTIALVLIGGSVLFLTGSEPNREDVAQSPDTNLAPADTAGDARVNDADGGSANEDGTDTPGNDMDELQPVEEAEAVTEDAGAGTYQEYGEDKLALAENGDVVLFFHATWCPSCRAADADIREQLTAIPNDTHILKVDYDSSTALKQQYGVTTQHTFVQVDESGTEIQQWTGGNTLDSIVAKL